MDAEMGRLAKRCIRDAGSDNDLEIEDRNRMKSAPLQVRDEPLRKVERPLRRF